MHTSWQVVKVVASGDSRRKDEIQFECRKFGGASDEKESWDDTACRVSFVLFLEVAAPLSTAAALRHGTSSCS
jgi:hypothetical protein